MHYTQHTRIRTASKFGRDGSSLSMRRIWYADPPNGQEAQNNSGNGSQSSTAGGPQSEDTWTPEAMKAEIKRLRDENAERRLALKQQQEAAAVAAKAEQERLASLGQWEQLAKQREAELAQYKPYQERASALEKLISESNQKRIEQIPEAMRSLVPEGSAESVAAYLDKNWAILMRKPAPDLDAGAGMGGGTKPLTAEQKQLAQKAGMTEDEYRAALAKSGLNQ